MFPNMEERPRQKSMIKKSTDHSGDTGIFVMASVKTMKARPVPSTPCSDPQGHLSSLPLSLLLYQLLLLPLIASQKLKVCPYC